MKQLMGLAVCAALVVLTGCSGIHGTWTMTKIDPDTAKGKFEFSRLTLNKDNTYNACAMYEGNCRNMAGTYEYAKGTDTLTFKTPDGKARSYKAKLVGMGGSMRVWYQGEDWKATLKRTKADATPCCPQAKPGEPPHGHPDAAKPAPPPAGKPEPQDKMQMESKPELAKPKH